MLLKFRPYRIISEPPSVEHEESVSVNSEFFYPPWPIAMRLVKYCELHIDQLPFINFGEEVGNSVNDQETADKGTSGVTAIL